jgi:molecular chaperone IbpA
MKGENKMTDLTFRTFDIPTLHRHAIGFDRLFNELNRTFANSKSDGNYPPYNIVSLSDDHFVIEVAVAGFAENELDIEIKDNVLNIKGEHIAANKVEGLEYLHKGISDRNFTRTFTLADNVEVKTATVRNGILSVALERIVPEEQRPKKIAIAFQK